MSRPWIIFYFNFILLVVFGLVIQSHLNTHSQAKSTYLSTMQDRIKSIETQLSKSHAVDKMNQNTATLEEREKFKKMLLDLHEYRTYELALRLRAIQEKFNNYEKVHSIRLSEHGIKKVLN